MATPLGQSLIGRDAVPPEGGRVAIFSPLITGPTTGGVRAAGVGRADGGGIDRLGAPQIATSVPRHRYAGAEALTFAEIASVAKWQAGRQLASLDTPFAHYFLMAIRPGRSPQCDSLPWL